MIKNFIFLALGIVITVLYVIFSTEIYEAMNLDPAFMDEMYNAHLYSTIASTIAITVWIVAAVYYYLINSVRFSRWYHWLIMLLLAILLAPSISIYFPFSEFSEEGKDYLMQLIQFNLINIGITILLFIIVSFSVRWWSTNCRHTPIPE